MVLNFSKRRKIMDEGFSIRLGFPLNEQTLSQMTKEERKFWMDFFEEAHKVIEDMKAHDETIPFTPPSSLKEKYQKAIIDYDGEKYCQIRQLQGIFTF